VWVLIDKAEADTYKKLDPLAPQRRTAHLGLGGSCALTLGHHITRYTTTCDEFVLLFPQTLGQ
jgi:hypothetical protein